jgi:hypothetical protein
MVTQPITYSYIPVTDPINYTYIPLIDPLQQIKFFAGERRYSH